MPHFPGHRPSRLEGLLAKGQGQGLFGPNIQQGGVGLGPGRNTLIGPNPAATKAMGSAINRFAPRGTPTPTSPRVMNTGGTSVADLFKGAKLGQFGARVGQPAAPMAGYDQFGPQAAQVQQVQGGPPTAMQGINALGTAAGTKVGGMMDINPGLRQLSEDTKAGLGAEEGPEGFMGKVGGFFNRTIGEKGSGKRSDIGRSMMSAGAAMMKGSPDGTFATIGQGLETGLGGYQELKEKRREESAWEEDERRREEVNAGIDASIREQVAEDGTILRRALNDEEAAMVRGAGGAEGVALAREIRQGTRARTAIDLFSIGADDDYLELLRAQDDQTSLALVTEYAKSEKGKAGRVAHLKQMGYSDEVAEDAAEDAATTQAVLNRGMETTVMRDGAGYLRVFHDGEYAGGFGEPSPVSGADAATLDAMKLTSNWDMLGDLRKSVTENYEVLKTDVQRLENVAETIRAVNDEDLEDYFGPTGGIEATFAAWVGLEDAAKIQNVKNLLTKFGIGNLADFKGAISEMELATALENAGSITQVKGLINAVLSRAMDNTIDKATTHNSRAKNLDSQFLNAETLQPVGEFFSKPNAFGFDTESLAGYATERDQIFDQWLDRATGETIDVGSDEFLVPGGEPEMGILDVRSQEDFARLQAQKREQEGGGGNGSS